MNFRRTLLALFVALSLGPSLPAFAGFLDPFLRIIDEEFYRMSETPENLEWTEDYGVQPIDSYELDYAEKCEIIRSTKNTKALTACAIVLSSE